MQPIPFYVIPAKQVARLTAAQPVPADYLQTYLTSRPGILDDGQCDIFEPNCRSQKQRWTNFSLFERRGVHIPGETVVFPFWLELFEAAGCRQNIRICIDWLKSLFPASSPVVIQWNHDRDAADVPELQNLPDNFFVLNFNTSRPTRNDILLPFWAIETWVAEPPPVPQYFAGFVGFGNIPIRNRLREFVKTQPEHTLWDEMRISEEEYLRQMQRCRFCLCPRGGGLNSYRTYEAIQCGRVPVIFADEAALPYPWMDWPGFSIRGSENGLDKTWNDMRQMVDSKRIAHAELYLQAVRQWFSLWGVQTTIHERLREFRN